MRYFDKLQAMELGDQVSTMILGGCAVFLASASYFVAGDSMTTIGNLLIGYLGYSAYILVPMTVVLLAIVIQILLLGRLEAKSPWSKVAIRIETLAPVIGILGTFVGIGIGLSDLPVDQLNSMGIFELARQIGAAVWNSVVGLVLGMVAYLVVRDGIKEEEQETVLSRHPFDSQIFWCPMASIYPEPMPSESMLSTTTTSP